MRAHCTILFAFAVTQIAAIYSLKDCETLTVGKEPTVAQEFANSKCWLDAVTAANKAPAGMRVALIPENTVVSMMPVELDNLKDVTLIVDGTVLASMNWRNWPVGKAKSSKEIGTADH